MQRETKCRKIQENSSSNVNISKYYVEKNSVKCFKNEN